MICGMARHIISLLTSQNNKIYQAEKKKISPETTEHSKTGYLLQR